MASMSLSLICWALAFSSSTSTKSCGWVTLKLVNRPASRGSRLPSSARFSTAPCKRPQAGTAAVLHLQLEAARGAQAFDRRRTEDADPRRGDRAELLAQPRDDRWRAELRLASPLLERLEDHEHAADVADVRAQHGRVAGQVDRVGDARLFAGDLAHLADDLVGAVERRAVGKLRVENQIALVLLGNEADRHGLEAEVGQTHQAAVDQQHNHADAQQPADHPAVDVDRDVEEPVEPAEECAEQRD